MPSRILPHTNTLRAKILRKASLKGNNTAPADRAVPATLWAKLDLTATTSQAKTYIGSLALTKAAEQALGASTEITAPLAASALQLISHFLQVVDLAIDRNFWPPSVREFYGRPLSGGALPDLTSYDDALEWGDNIATGETNRVNAGGVPMAFPSAEEVRVPVYNLTLALGPHTIVKDGLTDAQQAVEDLLPGPDGIDQLILDLYDEVEHFYRHLPDGARRDKCREWGLIYEGDVIVEDSSSSTSSSSSSTP